MCLRQFIMGKASFWPPTELFQRRPLYDGPFNLPIATINDKETGFGDDSVYWG